jgi:hypothetical protein
MDKPGDDKPVEASDMPIDTVTESRQEAEGKSPQNNDEPADDEPMRMADNQDGGDDNDECELVHSYEKFRMDLTPKPWFEQQRKQAYIEFDAPSPSKSNGDFSGWRWDESWQLKAKGNGSVSFCIQADSMNGATVQVGLAGEDAVKNPSKDVTCIITICSSKRSAVVERREHGTVMARSEGVYEACNNAATAPSTPSPVHAPAPSRPAPGPMSMT